MTCPKSNVHRIRSCGWPSRSCCWLAAVVIVFRGSLALGEAGGTDGIPDLDAVIAGLQRLEDAFLKSPGWFVRFEHTREPHHTPPGFNPNPPRREITNAQKGEWAFLHRIEFPDKKKPVHTWCSWKDNICVHRVFNNYQIFPEAQPILTEARYYTDGLFVDTHSKREFQSDVFASIAAKLSAKSPSDLFWQALPRGIERRRAEFQVRPKRETVDGVLCVVLERANKDILWIDDAHGYVCRRRLYYQAPGKPFAEFTNEDVVEHRPGLWLPRRQTVTRYNIQNDPPQFQGKVRYVEKNRLLEVSLGTVRDDVFTVPELKTGLVRDHIRGMQYKVFPKDTTPATALDRSIQTAFLEDNNASHSVLLSRQNLRRLAYVVAGLGAVTFIFLSFRHCRKRTK